MSVYEGVAPAKQSTEFSGEPLRARSVLDMHFVTLHKRQLGSAEWILVLARDAKTSASAGGAGVDWSGPSGASAA
jgi:hypothetical protein